jgi:hypothetical protein
VRWRALPAFAAIDFLSCLLVVFVAVAVTSRPPQVKTYGSYAVTVTWPAGPNDVDLYVRDPAGAVCYFQNMQADDMQLEHDDLGTAATSYGSRAPNEERTVIRGTSPGQYVVSTHLYARGQGDAPIPVDVQLWDLQGDDRVLKDRTVYLTHAGDQRMPFRFTLDVNGNVTGYSEVPVNLVGPSTNFGG